MSKSILKLRLINKITIKFKIKMFEQDHYFLCYKNQNVNFCCNCLFSVNIFPKALLSFFVQSYISYLYLDLKNDLFFLLRLDREVFVKTIDKNNTNTNLISMKNPKK